MVDQVKILNIFEVTNSYYPNCLLYPCDWEGDTDIYKAIDEDNIIKYQDGKIMLKSGKSLGEIGRVSKYYRVDPI